MGQLVSLLVLSLRSRGEQALHDTRRASDGASFHAANLGHLDPPGGGPPSCQAMCEYYTLDSFFHRRALPSRVPGQSADDTVLNPQPQERLTHTD